MRHKPLPHQDQTPRGHESRQRRAVLYVRARVLGPDATERAAEEQRFVDQQRRRCRKLAEQLGLTVVAEYTDLGGGTSNRQRPSLNALVDRLGQGDIANIIVDSFDRLARQREEFFELVETFNAHGACLIDVAGMPSSWAVVNHAQQLKAMAQSWLAEHRDWGAKR